MSKQAYQFRLYPTKKQAQALQWTLDRARELYNAALSGLNKSILDAGWGQFQQFCRYKAARAGRSVLCVNPRYTSQVCSGCGTIKKKALDER